MYRAIDTVTLRTQMSKAVTSKAGLDDDDSRIAPIVQRLIDGTTTLIEESRALGFTHNGPLRRALKRFLGDDGYQQLPLADNARRRMIDAHRRSIHAKERAK